MASINEFFPISGYEGSYRINHSGDVFSELTNKILSPALDKHKGYLKVSLRKNGSSKTIYVHVLMALTFLGERPENMVVDHIDNNRLNNNVENLRYCTNRENIVAGKICKLSTSKKSSCEGVSFTEKAKKWQVSRFVTHEGIGRTIYIGLYEEEQEAIENYEKIRDLPVAKLIEIDDSRKANLISSMSSKHKGVSWHKRANAWIARKRFTFNGIGMTLNLGFFEDEGEAALEAEKGRLLSPLEAYSILLKKKNK